MALSKEGSMPTETIIALFAIATPFVIFAATLAWTDFYSHRRRRLPAHHVPAE